MGWLRRNVPPPAVQAHASNTPAYPMMNYSGLVTPSPARMNGRDIDQTPRQFRHYVDASGVRSVQIRNGLWNGVGRGIVNIPGYAFQSTAYLVGAAPVIPGQTRGDVSGFHKRGPSSYNIQNMFQAGPGSQPTNPGGPGQIASNMIYNPMSG